LWPSSDSAPTGWRSIVRARRLDSNLRRSLARGSGYCRTRVA
jgi:hypothetical protein